eukprot:Hpha_TRINITY_DN10317_c0_g1::TRINITY_DN10317_c0_g1_i1::g.116098::m.116098
MDFSGLSDGPVPPPEQLRDMWYAARSAATKAPAPPPDRFTGWGHGVPSPGAAPRIPEPPRVQARKMRVGGPRARSAAAARLRPSGPSHLEEQPELRLAAPDAVLRLAAHDALSMMRSGQAPIRRGRHRRRFEQDHERASLKKMLSRKDHVPREDRRQQKSDSGIDLSPIRKEDPMDLSCLMRSCSPPRLPVPAPEDAFRALCRRVQELWREVDAPYALGHCMGNCKSVCQRCVRLRHFSRAGAPEAIHALNLEVARLCTERDALFRAREAFQARDHVLAALRNLAERYRVWGLAVACPAREGRAMAHSLRELLKEVGALMRDLRDTACKCVKASVSWRRASKRRRTARHRGCNALLALCNDAAMVLQGEALQCALPLELRFNPFVTRDPSLAQMVTPPRPLLLTAGPGTPRRAVAELRLRQGGERRLPPAWEDALGLPQSGSAVGAAYESCSAVIAAELTNAITLAQCTWRGFSARRFRAAVVDGRTRLQRIGRGALDRWNQSRRLRHTAAVRIQAQTRRVLSVRRAKHIRQQRTVPVLQAAGRSYLCRRELSRLAAEVAALQQRTASVLQAAGRSYLCRRELSRLAAEVAALPSPSPPVSPPASVDDAASPGTSEPHPIPPGTPDIPSPTQDLPESRAVGRVHNHRALIAARPAPVATECPGAPAGSPGVTSPADQLPPSQRAHDPAAVSGTDQSSAADLGSPAVPQSHPAISPTRPDAAGASSPTPPAPNATLPALASVDVGLSGGGGAPSTRPHAAAGVSPGGHAPASASGQEEPLEAAPAVQQPPAAPASVDAAPGTETAEAHPAQSPREPAAPSA